MDWNDFAKRLTLELSRLPVTSFLIVQGPSGLPYAQAMRAEGVLDAETVSSAFLPRPLAPRQERRLRSLGWEPPDGEERKNWWSQYTLRERGSKAREEHLEACALVAGLMMGSFRDVYGVESPLELVYQASRTGPEGGPLALPGLGIPLAVPEDEKRASSRAPRPSGPSLETALTDARERGDQQGYLELLARAVLYLPAPPGAPGEHRFATARFGDGTYVLAFTSPEAMDRSLQGQAVHHRQASLAELARRWPHPEWQLAVNPGLPSASYLDAKALFDSDEPRKPSRAPSRRPSASLPPAPTDVHVAGASHSRTKTRGGSAAGRKAPRAPEDSAPPRTAPRSSTAGPGGGQTRTRPSGVPSANATAPSPAPPRQRRPADSPAAPSTPGGGAATPAREPAGGPGGRPVHARGGPPPPASNTAPDTAPNTAPNTAPDPHPARATPTDPHGLPVMPAPGRRDVAETAPSSAPPAPPRAAQGAPAPTRETPVPRRDDAAPRTAANPVQNGPAPNIPVPNIPAQKRAGSAPGGPGGPGGTGRQRNGTQNAPVDGEHPVESPSQIVVVQKVLRPEHVHHYLEGGYDLVAGYVHRLVDVRELTTPAAVIRALGLIYEGSPFAPTDEQIHVIRWPAVKPALFRRPLGGIDEWSMGIIPGGWVIEKAPFPGSGYAPGDGPAIPEFKIESQRLPHGAEMYRIAADGGETLVAAYDADLRRWLVRLPGAREERA